MSISVTVSGDDSTSVISSQLNTGSITVSGSESIQVTSAGVNSASVTVSTGDPITITGNFSNFVTGSVVRPNEISSFITSSDLSSLETATGNLNTRVNSNDSDIISLNTATGSLSTATGLLVPKSETGSFLTSGQIDTNINTAVSNLVDSAPSTLNTLNELAASLGDDANFSTSIATSLGNKVNKSETGSFAVTGTDVTFTNLTVEGNILPENNITSDIGSPSKKFRDLYLDGNSIFLGNSKISFSGGVSGGLNITGSGITGRFLQDVETGDILLPLQTATGELSSATGVLSNINENITGATGILAIATGNLTGATGELSTATGNLSTATGALNTNIGTVSGLITSNNLDISNLNTATGVLTGATGELSVATGFLSVATGTLTGATGELSVATGTLTGATGELSTATGELSIATGTLTGATGALSTATGTLNTNIDTVSGLITSNDSDISALNTATGLLTGATGALSTATGVLQGVTGSFAQTGSGNFGLLNVEGVITSETGKIILRDTIIGSDKEIVAGGNNLRFFNVHGVFGNSVGIRNNRGSVKGMEEGATSSDLGLFCNSIEGISIQTGGNVIVNAGNLGIGTGSPSAPLHVVGSGIVTSNFAVDTQTFFVNAANNRVGIGTNSPATDFEVDGSQIVFELGGEKGLDINNGAFRYKIGDIDGGETQNHLDINSTDGYVRFLNPGAVGINGTPVGTTNKLQVFGPTFLSGNVGIRTSSPRSLYALHVDDNFLVTNGGEDHLNVDTTSYIYKFGDISGGDNGSFLEINSPNGVASFNQAFLGVNVALPQAALHVNGTATVSGGLTTLGKTTLSSDAFVIETGSFTLGNTHKGATVLLQNSASINITIPSQVSGYVTTFIAETHNPVSFITGSGMSGLNSFNGASDIAGIYGQAQVIYKSPEYAFLGGNIV